MKTTTILLAASLAIAGCKKDEKSAEDKAKELAAGLAKSIEDTGKKAEPKKATPASEAEWFEIDKTGLFGFEKGKNVIGETTEAIQARFKDYIKSPSESVQILYFPELDNGTRAPLVSITFDDGKASELSVEFRQGMITGPQKQIVLYNLSEFDADPETKSGYQVYDKDGTTIKIKMGEGETIALWRYPSKE